MRIVQQEQPAQLFLLPPYSPDLNPIKMVFATWPLVKESDPKAVLVVAESDSLGVIGTDVFSVLTLGKLRLD